MAKKTRAKDELMGQLHLAVANDLLTRVNSGEATAQELAQAIKFLQNNGIQGEVEQGSALGELEKQVNLLPQFDDEPGEDAPYGFGRG